MNGFVVETLADFHEAARKDDVTHINLDTSTAQIMGFFSEYLDKLVEVFANPCSGICGLTLGGEQSLDGNDNPELRRDAGELFSAVGSLENLKHLIFDGFTTTRDHVWDHSPETPDVPERVYVLQVKWLTRLFQDLGPTLESLVLATARLMGTPDEYEDLFRAIAGLRSLRRIDLGGTNEIKLYTDTLGGRYPLAGAVTAISKLPFLADVDIMSDDWTNGEDEKFDEATLSQLQTTALHPIQALLSSSTIRKLTIASHHKSSPMCIGQALQRNQSLQVLNCLLCRRNDSVPPFMDQLGVLTHAIRVNTTLQQLRIDLWSAEDQEEDPLPNLTTFIQDLAKALTRNSTLLCIKVEVEADTLAYNQSGDQALVDMFASNHTLHHLDLSMRDGKDALHESRRAELDIFMRLNQQGRKQILRSGQAGNASREEWLDLFGKLSNDLDAVHYYIRSDPGLVQYLSTTSRANVSEGGLATKAMNPQTKKRSLTIIEGANPEKLLHKKVRQLEEENQRLRMEKLEEENRALRLENDLIRAKGSATGCIVQ